MSFRKFYDVKEFVLLKLFKIYCCQFYGIEMWFDPLKYKTNLRNFAVGYHREVNLILKYLIYNLISY